jgi:hypothetical protein
MRRLDDGAGCGARAQVSQTRAREALATRPPARRPAAFNGCTRRGRRRAEVLRIRGANKRPLRPARKRGTRDRKAAMARREAPRVRKGTCTKEGCADRRAVPLVFEGKGGRRACPGPRQRIRAMAFGCLKIESVSARQLLLPSSAKADDPVIRALSVDTGSPLSRGRHLRNYLPSRRAMNASRSTT